MTPVRSVGEKVNKPDSAVVGVFWALVGVFLFILGQFFIPAVTVREPTKNI